ncbi:chromosome partitioning protein ParA [Pseudomonas sp. ZM23]|uniref:Chromosome partitioning protein ParA n=1 Tax=Pseudomonas triclosanedens TaxID=2961893 RepID=A0ABY6ZTY9_9PSED|nr:chromosome partitioning protein ParA [Pseudomonas triclosanedens]MCP8466615.1 chromosome partitioning protein ParA [Pseudomonas triclosanedens]MCP8472030.1 chromosome partitioning protein ParA [Pseudomonas triclosanedens]MCP8474586.1 chromosome partitioning protein ParA [Pseudomonas triclosanedens]WAI48037.1 chromosome partitioning protein ParA [Pseudomonas triclosanedens]
MSMQKKPQMVEAVVFFNDRGVCKEMLYPEFEALLDNVVQMPEYADQQMRLAYVLINSRLMVRAVVFFYLDFDEKGEADRGWNLPLRNLADRAGRGPDMGAGPIRLACRSQCPVSWHQMHLWDPSLDSGNNHLVQLRDAVKRNHLGVLVEEETAAVEPQRLQMAAEHQWYAPAEESREEAEKLARAMLEEHQQKTAAMLGQHETRLSQISQQHEQELSRLKMGAQEQIKVLQAEVAALRDGLAREEEINASLRRELDGQVSGFQRGREELTAQLRHIEQSGRDELEQLRQQIEDEAKARIVSLEARYKEQISIRDVELSYRNELDQQLQHENQQFRQEAERLREEVAQLRQQAEHARQAAESLRQELATVSSRAADGSMLERLSALGVIFVVYHPGAGHLTLALQDVARYQENPMAFAASKCFVSEDQYRQWLAHYQQPSCEGRLSNGERCAMPIDRVETPGRFVDGDSNCCARHKTSGRLRSVTSG